MKISAPKPAGTAIHTHDGITEAVTTGAGAGEATFETVLKMFVNVLQIDEESVGGVVFDVEDEVEVEGEPVDGVDTVPSVLTVETSPPPEPTSTYSSPNRTYPKLREPPRRTIIVYRLRFFKRRLREYPASFGAAAAAAAAAFAFLRLATRLITINAATTAASPAGMTTAMGSPNIFPLVDVSPALVDA